VCLVFLPRLCFFVYKLFSFALMSGRYPDQTRNRTHHRNRARTTIRQIIVCPLILEGELAGFLRVQKGRPGGRGSGGSEKEGRG